jgi:hypothetical protein
VAAADVEAAERGVRLAGPAGEAGDVETLRRRRVLHAIEAYKAACAAEGREPTEEESWLILLAALHFPD